MDSSTPGLPVHHQLPELAQTYVRWSWWCHWIISSSVVPFSSHLQSFPASGSFPMSQFFASDGQSIGVSASASVLPMNIQDWFPLGWTGWVSLLSKGLKSLLQHHSSKALILQCSVSVSNWIWIFRVHRSSLCWWNVFGGPGQDGNWSYRYGWLYTSWDFLFLPTFLPLSLSFPSPFIFASPFLPSFCPSVCLVSSSLKVIVPKEECLIRLWPNVTLFFSVGAITLSKGWV